VPKSDSTGRWPALRVETFFERDEHCWVVFWVSQCPVLRLRCNERLESLLPRDGRLIGRLTGRDLDPTMSRTRKANLFGPFDGAKEGPHQNTVSDALFAMMRWGTNPATDAVFWSWLLPMDPGSAAVCAV
jgi:hypothetical protein